MKRKTLATVGSILGEQVEDRPGECPALDGGADHGGVVCPDRDVALQSREVFG